MKFKKILPKIQKVFLLLFALGLLLHLFGCAGHETSGLRSGSVTETDRDDKDDTVILGAGRHLAPGNKDAMYCSKILGVWEPLVTHDDKGFPKPALAAGWRMEDGGKVWIFNLRQNVFFHNGTMFTADTVIKNFDRMKKGYKRSTFYGLSIDNYYPSLIKYEKLDDYTIKLTFAEPNINQLYKMMDFGSPIYAPECFASDGNFRSVAIGTGPYKITENALNKYVVLERYDGYYGEKAKIKRVIVKNIPSPDVRYAALKAGEILGVLDINAMPPFLAAELVKDERFAVSTNKSTMTRWLGLNGKKFPFNVVRMRRAVSLAIDRKALVSALYLDYAKPTSNPLNYTSPYYVEFPVRYDLAEAKRLAREVLGGSRCKISYFINGGEPLQKGEAELIAYWLKEIGLDVTISTLEPAMHYKLARQGEHHITRMQNGLPNGDPYSMLYSFLMPNGGRSAACSFGYENEEAKTLLDEAKHAVDETRRREIFTRLQEIAVEEQPTVPLFYDLNIVAYSRKLKNYHALIYGVELDKMEWAGQ